MHCAQRRYAIFSIHERRRHDIIIIMKLSDAVAVLSALAQESRLEIIRFLIRVGPAGASAGSIGDHLEVHSATLSFHLNSLRQAGLVVSRRESRSIIYTANYACMTDLMSYLMENCCTGDALQADAALAAWAGCAR